MSSLRPAATCDITDDRPVRVSMRSWPARPAIRRGALLVDVCLFGFLTAFLILGLIVILAPESDFARAVFHLTGVKETAASPSAAATRAETTRSEPVAWSEPMPPRESRRPASPPAPEEVRQPSKPDFPNERREIERFADDADGRIDAVQKDYYLEMEGFGWSSILEPWHLVQDDKLFESKAIVRQAGSVVGKYEARSFTVIRELRADIYRLAISDWSKKKLEAILERYVIDARWGELWELEKREIAGVRKLVDLLAASKRGVAWKIDGNRLLFANPSSLLTNYNATMAELDRISGQKLRIYREVAAVRKKRLRENKRLEGDG